MTTGCAPSRGISERAGTSAPTSDRSQPGRSIAVPQLEAGAVRAGMVPVWHRGQPGAKRAVATAGLGGCRA